MTQPPTLPRVFCVYNPKGFEFNPGCPVIPWQNCGMGSLDRRVDEPLRLPQPVFPGSWCMMDREDPEQYRANRAEWWGRIAGVVHEQANLIAYDPFGWDPAQLRTASWWLKLQNRVGFGAAVAHMNSRRKLLPYLSAYRALATDVYLPRDYTYDQYAEWASLKVNAHVRLCVEGGFVPVVLLDLRRDIRKQTRFANSADKRVRWGLWQDPTTWEDAALHAAMARAFVLAMGEEVSQ